MQFVFLNEKTIRAFLKLYGRGSESKDYELLGAILLKRFCEMQWGKECVIGFKLKEKYTRELPNFGHKDIDGIRSIIRRQIDEDDSIDFAIVEGPLNKVAKQRVYGPAFQLKRFGKDPNANDTNALIDYLNAIPKKYSKVNAALFVILETDKEIDFKKVRERLLTTNYPFIRIMFMCMSSDKVYIGEIWPNSGMNEYGPQELIRPMYVL